MDEKKHIVRWGGKAMSDHNEGVEDGNEREEGREEKREGGERWWEEERRGRKRK